MTPTAMTHIIPSDRSQYKLIASIGLFIAESFGTKDIKFSEAIPSMYHDPVFVLDSDPTTIYISMREFMNGSWVSKSNSFATVLSKVERAISKMFLFESGSVGHREFEGELAHRATQELNALFGNAQEFTESLHCRESQLSTDSTGGTSVALKNHPLRVQFVPSDGIAAEVQRDDTRETLYRVEMAEQLRDHLFALLGLAIRDLSFVR